ncbi:putative RNA-binding protein with PIN domain [Clostridium beijerinckii]|nr:putative RNA-binding protein with PIN domain [Clostridium beijerinckii]
MSSLEFYNEVLRIEKSIKNKADKNRISQKNIISDNIDDRIVKILEEIRRSK